MNKIIIQKPIPASTPRLIYNRVFWSFKGDQNNPVSTAGPLTASMSVQGLTLLDHGTGREWRVFFDKDGFILRGNGCRLEVNGQPVNALSTKAGDQKQGVSFWDVVFERDRPPIETRKEAGYTQFNRALKILIENGDDGILNIYAKMTAGRRGEIRFRNCNDLIVWGLVLQRRFAGKEVLLAALRQGSGFSLGVYDPDPSSPSHIYTYCLDRTVKEMFMPKPPNKREFFRQVPETRVFSYGGKDFYLNQRFLPGEIMVIEENGGGAPKLHREEQTKLIPVYSIEKEGQVTGYLVGDIWPSWPLPITGKINKEIPVYWDSIHSNFILRVFGRTYHLLQEDAIRLKISHSGHVFAAMEDGLVTEVSSKGSRETIYFRTIRDESFKLLSSTRTIVPGEQLQNGIRIIEGLETTRLRDYEGVLISKKFHKIRKIKERAFTRHRASVAISIKDGLANVLYGSFAARFSPDDRDIIDFKLFTSQSIITIEDFRARFKERQKGLAIRLAPALNGYNTPLKTSLSNLSRFLSRPDITALDIALVIDIIYELATEDNPYNSRFLEIFAEFHTLLKELQGEALAKVRTAFSLMVNIKKLKELVKMILNNRNAEANLEQAVFDHPFRDQDGV